MATDCNGNYYWNQKQNYIIYLQLNTLHWPMSLKTLSSIIFAFEPPSPAAMVIYSRPAIYN